MRRTSLFVLSALGIACGEAVAPAIDSAPLEAGRISECAGSPAQIRARDGFVLENRRGWIVPAYPEDGEEVFVAIRVPHNFVTRAFVRWSADDWQSEHDLELELWCDDVMGRSLGAFSTGQRLEAV